jgi:hypothetical protein
MFRCPAANRFAFQQFRCDRFHGSPECGIAQMVLGLAQQTAFQSLDLSIALGSRLQKSAYIA